MKVNNIQEKIAKSNETKHNMYKEKQQQVVKTKAI